MCLSCEKSFWWRLGKAKVRGEKVERLFSSGLEVSNWPMALRKALGWSDGELMRSDAKPCSRLLRQTAGIFTVGGALGFWILCRLHYGPRVTVPRSLRWAACGAVSVSSTSALLVHLFSPECEPQNIAAYDLKKWSLYQHVVYLLELSGTSMFFNLYQYFWLFASSHWAYALLQLDRSAIFSMTGQNGYYLLEP